MDFNITSGQTFSSNSVDIDGGSIDGTTIGSTSTSTGAFTTISASDLVQQMEGLLLLVVRHSVLIL